MNWFRIANIGNKIYRGNCITGLKDSSFQDALDVYDATDLAQLVANGTKISFDKFLSMVELYHDYDFDFDNDSTLNIEIIEENPKNYEFYFDPRKNIAWLYNIGEDVEYFYA